MFYFLDSSALVKYYVAERGSAWVNALANPESGNVVGIAQITVSEVAAALASKSRARTIQLQEFDLAVINLLQDAANYFVVVAIDQYIVQQSVDVIRRNALRGYDAVQLTCALSLNASLVAAEETPLVFVTADTDLLAAAKAEGLQTDDPNVHQ
jgi:hypothetical protein